MIAVGPPQRDRFCAVRRLFAAVAGAGAGALAISVLRHGVDPAVDAVSYWSGARSLVDGHGLTTTLAPSFSNFGVLDVLQRGGRLPFVDFPAGYPLLLALLSVVGGVRRAMALVGVVSLAALGAMVATGPRQPGSAHPAAALSTLVSRSLLALGIAGLPVTLLLTRSGVAEPVFCALMLAAALALIAYAEGHGRLWPVVALIIACGLIRFIGAAFVVVLIAVMVRRRDNLRRITIASFAAVIPVAINVIWASRSGTGHGLALRTVNRTDALFFVRAVGGWFDHDLGDLRATYFGPDRGLPIWAVILSVLWMFIALGALVTIVVGRWRARARVPMRAAIPLALSGVLALALGAAMVGFDSLVQPDNRLMLPSGVATLAALAWSIRIERPLGALLTPLLCAGWLVAATTPRSWFADQPTAGYPALEPRQLPSGRPVGVVISPEADLVHWTTGLPAAYLPLRTKLLTGEAVDLDDVYARLPCAMARADAMLIATGATIFSDADSSRLTRLVEAGQLEQLSTTLGPGYVATSTVTQRCPPP